jgi:hypothetical protein
VPTRGFSGIVIDGNRLAEVGLDPVFLIRKNRSHLLLSPPSPSVMREMLAIRVIFL